MRISVGAAAQVECVMNQDEWRRLNMAICHRGRGKLTEESASQSLVGFSTW